MLPHFAPGMPGQRDRMLLKGQALYPSAFVSEIGLLQAPLLRPYSCRAKLTFKCRAFATKFSRKRESHYQCSFKSCTLESANNPAERNSNERAKW